MTKLEYFRKIDYNNLNLRAKIEACLYLLDNDINSVSGKTDSELTFRCDELGTPQEDGTYYKANSELATANRIFLEEFFDFEEITLVLKANRYDIEKTLADLRPKIRDEKINSLLD